ncbi:MAG: type II secretion system protein [Phycisphaerae bacterium]
MKSRKYKHGLTLVEMVIVVAIIALLSTMVIGIVSRIDNQAKEKGLANIFALLESALQEYHQYSGNFPEQAEKDFAKAPAHSEYLYKELQSIPTSRQVLEKISDSLMRSSPGAVNMPQICDPWGMVLDYRYAPGDNFPELISAGPDKIFDTADDISSK